MSEGILELAAARQANFLTVGISGWESEGGQLGAGRVGGRAGEGAQKACMPVTGKRQGMLVLARHAQGANLCVARADQCDVCTSRRGAAGASAIERDHLFSRNRAPLQLRQDEAGQRERGREREGALQHTGAQGPQRWRRGGCRGRRRPDADEHAEAAGRMQPGGGGGEVRARAGGGPRRGPGLVSGPRACAHGAAAGAWKCVGASARIPAFRAPG
jgi:hypothetical protein